MEAVFSIKETYLYFNFSAVSSYVYLGAHNLYDTETGRKIIKTSTFISHPEYDQNSIANDVSLVRLPQGSLTSYTGNINNAQTFISELTQIGTKSRESLTHYNQQTTH